MSYCSEKDFRQWYKIYHCLGHERMLCHWPCWTGDGSKGSAPLQWPLGIWLSRKNEVPLLALCKNFHRLSERLAFLGKMRAKLGAPLTSLNTMVLWWPKRVQRSINRAPMMPRDTSLSSSYILLITVIFPACHTCPAPSSCICIQHARHTNLHTIIRRTAKIPRGRIY